MTNFHPDFRSLYDAVLSHDGWSLYWQVLAPWLDSHEGEVEWLRAFAARGGDPIPPASDEDLWALYALSRAHDLLLTRFQPYRPEGTSFAPGTPLSLAEYIDFARALGFGVSEPSVFSSFYHEVVEVEVAASPDEPASVVACFWPCLMLGDLLFSRAGALISVGANAMDKEIAETSTLYWAYRRRNRPTNDLSFGWGSNSQWRTRFRRDYRIAGSLHYNVDGSVDLEAEPLSDPDDSGLTQNERIELLTHRCFVATTKPFADLFPFGDTLFVSAS